MAERFAEGRKPVDEPRHRWTNRDYGSQALAAVAVLLSAAGLGWLFPHGAEAIPCCLALGLPLYLLWVIWRVWGRTTPVIASCSGTLAVLLGMFVGCWLADSVVQVKTAEPRVSIMNQLKQIALALRAYHDQHGTFPPAAARNAKGKPLYSWRVLVLPYLGEKYLYAQFHRDEPWDSPHNKTLLGRVPPAYAPTGLTVAPDASMTFYQVFVGPGAAFEGDKGLHLPADFPDGSADTILVAEARKPVPWTEPADLAYAADRPLPELGSPRRYRLRRLQYGEYVPPSFSAAMVDGSVRSLQLGLAPPVLRAWITRNGGDTPSEE
ncbi:MAG TPA: DUF1559 domain-containing protein [Gemmataceae bacterium]|jgi:hypothetical protein|nr:DUF1559 domain-containing protein [Gemmataceae bacterium]